MAPKFSTIITSIFTIKNNNMLYKNKSKASGAKRFFYPHFNSMCESVNRMKPSPETRTPEASSTSINRSSLMTEPWEICSSSQFRGHHSFSRMFNIYKSITEAKI